MSHLAMSPALAGRSLAPSGTLTAPAFPLRLRCTPLRTALPSAHAVENLDETEIDLADFHVDPNDLHLHAVAESIDFLGVLAAQQVRALDEPVIVVGHRGHMDQPLHEMLDQLDEQPERGDAGHVALELVADLVGHELHF